LTKLKLSKQCQRQRVYNYQGLNETIQYSFFAKIEHKTPGSIVDKEIGKLDLEFRNYIQALRNSGAKNELKEAYKMMVNKFSYKLLTSVPYIGKKTRRQERLHISNLTDGTDAEDVDPLHEFLGQSQTKINNLYLGSQKCSFFVTLT